MLKKIDDSFLHYTHIMCVNKPCLKAYFTYTTNITFT